MSADELASSELRKWREEEERRHIEENVMLTSDRPSNHAGYDVLWWTLEMAESSSEWVSVNSVRNRGDLQHFLRNFVPDKRLGVLDTGTKEKNLYFVPPALDPVTASPVATLSFVAEGCYKQFCHLLYIRKRARPRPKTTRP